MSNIAIIHHNLEKRGGVERVATELGNALSSNNLITLISICQCARPSFPIASNVNYISLMFSPEKRLSKIRGECGKKLSSIIKENHISLVIFEGEYAAFLGSGLKYSTNAKIIFCDHGALMNQWDNKKATMMRFIGALSSNVTVTLTERNRRDYIRKFHFLAKKVFAIPNWIDKRCQRSTRYQVESKRIIAVGRLSYEKAFNNLISAFSIVRDRHSDWALDIYGEGEDRPKLEQLIYEKKLDKHVRLCGEDPNLIDRYQEYAMLVLSSSREGFPLVLLEAKANRLPLISYDIVTGPAEIIRNGEDGILVEAGAVDKLADSICTLIENPNLRCRMSESSQSNIDQFSKETIFAQWENLISQILT